MGLPDISKKLPSHVQTSQASRLQTYLQHVDTRLAHPLAITIYGSAAVAFYLADDPLGWMYGYTRDIDIGDMEPEQVSGLELNSEVVDPPLIFQTYQITRWLVHPDWRDARIDIGILLQLEKLQVFLLHPVDLIISKLERAADQDIEDGQLLRARYVDDPSVVRRRLREAAKYYPINHRIVAQIEYSFAGIFEEELDLSDLV